MILVISKKWKITCRDTKGGPYQYCVVQSFKEFRNPTVIAYGHTAYVST